MLVDLFCNIIHSFVAETTDGVHVTKLGKSRLNSFKIDYHLLLLYRCLRLRFICIMDFEFLRATLDHSLRTRRKFVVDFFLQRTLLSYVLSSTKRH